MYIISVELSKDEEGLYSKKSLRVDGDDDVLPNGDGCSVCDAPEFIRFESRCPTCDGLRLCLACWRKAMLELASKSFLGS